MEQEEKIMLADGKKISISEIKDNVLINMFRNMHSLMEGTTKLDSTVLVKFDEDSVGIISAQIDKHFNELGFIHYWNDRLAREVRERKIVCKNSEFILNWM